MDETLKQLYSIISNYFGVSGENLLLSKSNIYDSLKELSAEKIGELDQILRFIPPAVESESFGMWVKMSREQLGLTQAEIGSWVSVGRDRISKLEANETKFKKNKEEDLRKKLAEHLRQKKLL